MFSFEFEGRAPTVDPEAFIAPTATLIGDVTVEAGASIWYGAVLRADLAPIIVRRGANVQDGAILHGPSGLVTDVGPGATVAHQCVVHGAVLEEECLVGNGAIVLDGARIGARSLIAAGSLVAAGFVVPEGVLAAGTPAVVKRPLEGTTAAMWVQVNPSYYAALAQRHRHGIKPLDTA